MTSSSTRRGASSAAATHTHYQVLNLQADLLAAAEPPDAVLLVKRAYRRALLRNHPDKTAASTAAAAAAAVSSSHQTDAALARYTVDQIGEAYAVLLTPQTRRAYDATLRRRRTSRRLRRAANGDDEEKWPDDDDDDDDEEKEEECADFQTGIENVDLDDLGFDDALQRWSRPCRCGNRHGFAFCEDDLQEASDDGVLMVACQDCSLWLKVHFAVVQDNE